MRCFSIRYSVDVQLDKTIVNKDSLKDPKSTRKARLEIKKKFEERSIHSKPFASYMCDAIGSYYYLQAQGGQEQMVFPKTSVLSLHVHMYTKHVNVAMIFVKYVSQCHVCCAGRVAYPATRFWRTWEVVHTV